VKKFSVLLILAGLLVFAGCSSDDSSDPDAGLFGEVSGILYDKALGEPIRGASVQLGSLTTSTNANGYYVFNKVKPGDYDITFNADGYQFLTTNVQVDAKDYLNDDPYGEWTALNGQLAAFLAWATGVLGYDPAGNPAGGNYAGDWTFNGDTYNVESLEGMFQIQKFKLESQYIKGIPAFLTGLVPLKGAIKGKIMLFDEVYGDSQNVSLQNATALTANVEVWLKVGGGGTTIGRTAATTEYLYGPVTTNNGEFLFIGIPVETNMTIVVNPFTQGGVRYDVSQAYECDSAGGFSAVSSMQSEYFEIARNARDQKFSDYGNVYLFAERSYVLINDAVTGTPAGPLSPTGSITLTFSEEINPIGFTARVALNNGIANGNNIPDSGAAYYAGASVQRYVDLDASWDSTGKTVTLTPSTTTINNNNGLVCFPLTRDETIPAGALRISGKGKSGNNIHAMSAGNFIAGGIPVYVQEGIKLISYNYAPAPASIPSRAVSIARTPAFELTFSKDVCPINSSFQWGSIVADYTISSTNGNVVYLWTPETLTNTPFSFTVANKIDLTDKNTRTIAPDGGFSWARTQRDLFLASSSLIKGKKFNPGTAAGTPFTFTFTRDIPADAEVSARLAYDMSEITDNINHDELIPLNPISISGRVISITPTARLNYNETYYLIFKVNMPDGEEILGGTWYTNYTDILDVQTSAGPTRYAIIIETGPDPTLPVFVEPVAAGVGSGTSKELLVIGNEISGNEPLKSGRAYYVEFEPAGLELTPPNAAMTTDNANVTVTVAFISDSIMSVTYTISGSNASEYIDYTDVPIADPTVPLDANVGRINVSGGLSFGAATIVK